jgi:Holliday junction DNA helicase RuvB
MTPSVTPARGGTSENELRPARLRDVIGQERTKKLLGRAVDSCFERKRPLEHTLLLGPSGTGKTTLAMTLAAELGVDVYHLSAPVSFETLLSLRTQMYDADLLFIDEIHQQAIAERRGKSAATTPEVLYSLMEDRTIVTPTGVLPYPRITVVGATTDPGRRPEPFLNRFALRPVLDARATGRSATRRASGPSPRRLGSRATRRLSRCTSSRTSSSAATCRSATPAAN